MSNPNLLIIMVDQMQAALLDAVESLPVPLPCLEQLRDRSIQFSHAYCPAPICTPTRASFQLGETVHHHGVIGNDRSMPTDRLTLADHLNAQGYQTGYIGKWHLDVGNPRGWQTFDTVRNHCHQSLGHDIMQSVDALHHGVAPYSVDEHVDGLVAQHGRELVQRFAHQDQPWAAMISFFGPHAPYFLPEKWHDLFDPDSLPLPDDFDALFENKPAIQETFRCRAWGEQWSKDKWRAIRAAYFGYCAMLDHLIRQILDEVPDDTVLLFLSDHGEMNGHLRMVYKGPMMYEALVRVPVLLHLPGQCEERLDARLIQTQDLTATLLGLAGVPQTTELDGRDLLDDQQPARDYVISEFYEANWVKPVVTQRVAMCRDRRWKYVFTEGQTEEFYDMSVATPEVENLIDQPPDMQALKQLRQLLRDKLSWVG